MYSISLQQINYFLVTAERGSISEASRMLFVAQPTVTKWIKQLEQELDVQLFLRTSGGMELTQAGRFLYEKWSKLMGDLTQSIEQVHAYDSALEEHLRIGCLAGCDYDHFLPRALAEFSAVYPHVKISIFSYGFKALREKLLADELDCIFTMTFDLENIRDLSQRVISELPLYIAMSTHHPLAAREHLDLMDVKDELMYIISPEECYGGGDLVIKACKRAGFEPARVQVVPNLPSMAMTIKQGRGVTLCSSEMRKGSEDLIRLYETKDLPVDSYVVVAWRSKNTSSATLRFVELTASGEK